MNDVGGEFFSPEQSTTTPVAVPSSPAKDSNIRPHGDMLKMMNPTPNGYSDVPNHKPKPEGQDTGKHHESTNNVDHNKHSSDHVKKKEHDESKHKSSSPSKSKESSKDSSKKEGHDGHKDKEKKHKSSHKESSKSKDSSHKHSEHQSKHNSEKKEDKHKSDSVKKEHQSSEGKPKTDNFKENEKIKDLSSKEHKEKHKEKHKDKHKDKEHKEKHKDKSSSSAEKPKEKSDKPKEKSDKPKDENSEKQKEKDKEKHKDKHKDKHGEKHKDKHKDKSSEKHKDKISEKHKEKSKEKHEEKSKEKPKEKHEEKSKEKHEEKSKEKHEEKSKEKHVEQLKAKPESKHKDSVVIKQELEFEESVQPAAILDASSADNDIVKDEPLSDDDIPLTARKASMNASMSIKREAEDSDDEPISAKIEKKVKSEKKLKKKKPASEDEDYEIKEEEEEEVVEKKKSKKKRKVDSDDDDEYASAKKPAKKKIKKEKTTSKTTPKATPKVKQEPTGPTASPTKRKKKDEEEIEVWKWWEEEKLEDGIKWKTLEHCGPVFAPAYERVPKNVKFYYDGKHMELSEVTEEVAGFYGKMLDHEYTSKVVFNTNFFKDWRKVMTPEEKEIITDLKKCNFNNFNDYYKMKSEERKAMTKEQKAVIKKENEELTAKYGFCIIDGHKQKIANFKIEPPGLFRGRGEHPKMGMLKRRIEAEDILINIGKESKPPPPPPGHKWKEVRHDNTVSWLASWVENILGSTKYIMLNPSSKLKGEKDWQKYETARKLKQHADRIRAEYTRDFKSKEMKVRQRAVALYFIDKLALRAGNEKDEDTADTVGCCSLRVEHITLDDEKDGQEYVVSFDFLGKDSIRYFNSVAVEKRAYKNLKLFMENKQPGDDLFDRLNTAILNKYLNDLMEGLTAKVFRTYNASKTLQEQLDLLTKEDMSLPEKILAYNRANRAVAILCNHQRAVPKGFSKAMDNLKQKMDDKVAQIKDFRKEVKQAKQAAKDGGAKDKMIYDKKKKRLSQLEEQLKKLDVQATDKEENKQIALGTSKLNYLDPRISVAWCKKWDVPIEKVYNRTQRDKFRWAIEMAGPDYKF